MIVPSVLSASVLYIPRKCVCALLAASNPNKPTVCLDTGHRIAPYEAMSVPDTHIAYGSCTSSDRHAYPAPLFALL